MDDTVNVEKRQPYSLLSSWRLVSPSLTFMMLGVSTVKNDVWSPGHTRRLTSRRRWAKEKWSGSSRVFRSRYLRTWTWFSLWSKVRTLGTNFKAMQRIPRVDMRDDSLHRSECQVSTSSLLVTAVQSHYCFNFLHQLRGGANQRSSISLIFHWRSATWNMLATRNTSSHGTIIIRQLKHFEDSVANFPSLTQNLMFVLQDYFDFRPRKRFFMRVFMQVVEALNREMLLLGLKYRCRQFRVTTHCSSRHRTERHNLWPQSHTPVTCWSHLVIAQIPVHVNFSFHHSFSLWPFFHGHLLYFILTWFFLFYL